MSRLNVGRWNSLMPSIVTRWQSTLAVNKIQTFPYGLHVHIKCLYRHKWTQLKVNTISNVNYIILFPYITKLLPDPCVLFVPLTILSCFLLAPYPEYGFLDERQQLAECKNWQQNILSKTFSYSLIFRRDIYLYLYLIIFSALSLMHAVNCNKTHSTLYWLYMSCIYMCEHGGTFLMDFCVMYQWWINLCILL